MDAKRLGGATRREDLSYDDDGTRDDEGSHDDDGRGACPLDGVEAPSLYFPCYLQGPADQAQTW
jgi:hypothetical protein